MSEWSRIAMIRAVLGAPIDDRVLVGIGDDAAVLAPPPAPLVWTIDASVEGVHFRRDLLSFADIGYRATMAAASDLAAMGAAPLGLLAALVLPPSISDADLEALARGQREAADALGTSVIGGNLARGGELSITTTALGVAACPLTRSGARPGDSVWMAGPVGLAAAGLAMLMAGATDARSPAIEAWRRPRARIDAGLAIASCAHAAIDVSDGLAQDVGHIATASDVAIVIDAAAIVTADLRAAAAQIGRDPIDLALHGGEDYALVAAIAGTEGPPGFVRIGAVTQHAGGPRVALRREDGGMTALDGGGFDHFAT